MVAKYGEERFEWATRMLGGGMLDVVFGMASVKGLMWTSKLKWGPRDMWVGPTGCDLYGSQVRGSIELLRFDLISIFLGFNVRDYLLLLLNLF